MREDVRDFFEKHLEHLDGGMLCGNYANDDFLDVGILLYPLQPLLLQLYWRVCLL